MSASTRRFRAEFFRPARVADGAGGYSIEWQAAFGRWVGMRLGVPVVSDEASSEAQKTQVLDHRMAVLEDPETRDVTMDWRVELMGRVMDVRAVGVPVGGEIMMSVQEGVSS